MRIIFGVSFAVLAFCGPAHAYDSFLPLGLGYSTSTVDLSTLTPRQRAAINQADIYETEIYKRQLRAKQFDSKFQNFQSDRNSSLTDNWINY